MPHDQVILFYFIFLRYFTTLTAKKGEKSSSVSGHWERGLFSGQTLLSYRAWVQVQFKMAALKHGARKFYDIPIEELSNLRHRFHRKKERNTEKLLNYIEENCIGKDVTFSGPYGRRKGM